jgi:hypothetical protein
MIWLAVLISALVTVPASMTVNKHYGQDTTLTEVMQKQTPNDEITVAKKK